MEQKTQIQKMTLSPALGEELIAMSARWEEENNCFGYRTNTDADFQGEDIFVARLDGGCIGYLLCHTYVQEAESYTVPWGSACLEIDELDMTFWNARLFRKLK